jgi:hypothetical protein
MLKFPCQFVESDYPAPTVSPGIIGLVGCQIFFFVGNLETVAVTIHKTFSAALQHVAQAMNK